MSSVDEQVEFLMSLDNETFDEVVVSEAKGKAAAPVVTALTRDLALAERWLRRLSTMEKRVRSNLKIEEVTAARGDDWKRRALHFEKLVSVRKPEVLEK